MKDEICNNCFYGQQVENMNMCLLNPPVVSDFLMKLCVKNDDDASFAKILEWGSVNPMTDPANSCQNWKKK